MGNTSGIELLNGLLEVGNFRNGALSTAPGTIHQQVCTCFVSERKNQTMREMGRRDMKIGRRFEEDETKAELEDALRKSTFQNGNRRQVSTVPSTSIAFPTAKRPKCVYRGR